MPLSANADASRSAAWCRRGAAALRAAHRRASSALLSSLRLCLLGSLHVLRIGIGNAVKRVLTLRVAKDILTESLQLGLNPLLLCRHFRGVAVADLRQGLAEAVGGLVDFTTILIGGKEIVHRHGGGVVQAAGHDRLTVQVRFQVAVFHLEQRISGALCVGFVADEKVIIAHHHRTECQYLDME